MAKIEIVTNSDYFKNLDKILRHKDYPISRKERRIRLQEAYMNWYNSGSAFAYVSDYGDSQFAKTRAVSYEPDRVNVEIYPDVFVEQDINWIISVKTNYPLFQSIRSIVQRAGHECKCTDDHKDCICDDEDSLQYIREFAASYGVNFILVKREFHRRNCLTKGCGNVIPYWKIEDPLRVIVYRHGEVNPWEVIKTHHDKPSD